MKQLPPGNSLKLSATMVVTNCPILILNTFYYNIKMKQAQLIFTILNRLVVEAYIKLIFTLKLMMNMTLIVRIFIILTCTKAFNIDFKVQIAWLKYKAQPQDV